MSPTPAVRRVLVQGGGIGGLVLSAALARRGITVDLVELRDGSPLGVGLNVPANALAALGEIGVREEVIEAGWSYEHASYCDSSGTPLFPIPPCGGAYGAPGNVGIGRPAYTEILHRAAEAAGAAMFTGVTTTRIHQDPDGVDVVIGDRESQRYDLVVGFDGIRSKIRPLITDASPVFTGSSAWRVTMKRHPAIDRILLGDCGGVTIVITPLSDDLMYFGAVTNEPDTSWREPDQLLPMIKERITACDGLFAEIFDEIGPDHTIVYTPLEYVSVPVPWHRDRLLIAGDAAHASPPQLAQGAAMTVEDGVVLAQELTAGNPLPEALATWYERRRPRARFVQDVSLAFLRSEAGLTLTREEQELLDLGRPEAMRRLSEQY